MKLLGSTTSPFVRKVRMCASELDIPLEFELVDVRTPNEALSKIAPVGKIPVLILDSDPVLYESDIISRYLCSTKSCNLFSANFSLEFELTLALINSSMDAAAGLIMEGWRELSPDKDRALQKLSKRLVRCLEELNKKSSQIQQDFSYLSISTACLMGYLDFRQQLPDWTSFLPNLLDWYQEVSNRASFTSTAPG